jgi:hypothetical protein
VVHPTAPSFNNAAVIRGHVSSLVQDAARAEEALDLYNLIIKQRLADCKLRGDFMVKNSVFTKKYKFDKAKKDEDTYEVKRSNIIKRKEDFEKNERNGKIQAILNRDIKKKDKEENMI